MTGTLINGSFCIDPQDPVDDKKAALSEAAVISIFPGNELFVVPSLELFRGVPERYSEDAGKRVEEQEKKLFQRGPRDQKMYDQRHKRAHQYLRAHGLAPVGRYREGDEDGERHEESDRE